MSVGAPESFDEQWMTDWSIWVLDHGLPEMPDTVEIGWSVPVARWVGDSVGAVLHVQWQWTEDHAEEQPDRSLSLVQRQPADFLISEVEILAGMSGKWQNPTGSGGTGWIDPPLARPERVGDRHIGVFGLHGDAVGDPAVRWATIYGVTAPPITYLRVSVDSADIRYPIESPTGAWIVGYRARPDFVESDVIVEGYDAAGQVVDRVSSWQQTRGVVGRHDDGVPEGRRLGGALVDLYAEWCRKTSAVTDDDDPRLAAYGVVHELVEGRPEAAWDVIRQTAIGLIDDEWALSHLGADALEELLRIHGPAFIDRAIEEARLNNPFARALASVWLFSDPIRPRIDQVLAELGLPLK